jgi:Zn-dependent protease
VLASRVRSLAKEPDLSAETLNTLAEGLTAYVVLLFSLSVHESAHAWTALMEGDPTAQSQGRISLNPLVHVDLIGTVIMPLLMIFGGISWLIGWAKPTPVDPRHFRNVRRGEIIVSGAGPVSNMALALLFTAGLFVAIRVIAEPALDNPVIKLLLIGVQLNVLLAIFNLVPLPPLDGSHIVQWALPNGLGHRYIRAIGPYGAFILLALVMTGALFKVLSPILNFVLGILYGLVSR